MVQGWRRGGDKAPAVHDDHVVPDEPEDVFQPGLQGRQPQLLGLEAVRPDVAHCWLVTSKVVLLKQ